MKTLSLMGALFLPGTYLASVFSMTFFNFQEGMCSPLLPSVDRLSYSCLLVLTLSSGASPVVSFQLWIYFAVTVPITALIVGAWLMIDKHRMKQAKRDDADLERNIEKMEKEIMFHLRKRTMSKTNTWNSIQNSKA